MIGAAPNWVDWDALWHGPVHAVIGRNHHEVIGSYGCAAACFQAAIWPNDIYPARLVNFSGGKGTGPNSARIAIKQNLFAQERLAPCQTTIGGPEGEDRGFEAVVDGNDHRAVGLHYRLS